MGWQDEEFGSSHDGSIGVLLADGTEPEPVYLDTGGSSGASFRKTNEWWAYDGHEYGGGYGRPRASWLRGACSCGWRGERYEVDWAGAGDWPDGVDTSGPYADWARHVEEVEARAIPLPEDVADLLEQMEDRLGVLEQDAPLAALRAAAGVERIARKIGWKVACHIDPGEVPWDEMGKALGWSGDALRSRLSGYAPESVRSGFWTESGVRLS